MTSRKFQLPNINELSKEQEAARALPKEGQHLIIGGPGTGKTVITLVRARRHHRDQDNYVFLVWNHLLHRFTTQLAGALRSETWEKWFGDQIQELTGEQLPRTAVTHNDYSPIDWDEVAALTDGTKPIIDPPYLVIDEGQDMPPQFYRALVALGFERFFVAADQNQQITDTHSSRTDIETELFIDTKDVIELRENYRNSTPIAKLARAFYTGDPASPPPALPDRRGVVPQLISYDRDNFDEVCLRIIRLYDRDPTTLLGVLAPNNNVRENYFRGLSEAAELVRLDNAPPTIETFYGQNKPDVGFSEGGILVINAQACKGLEFDVVVLADVDRHYYQPTAPDLTKKRFYVMIARAQKRVILLRRRDDHNRIEDLLPNDPEVLQRRELSNQAVAGAYSEQSKGRRVKSTVVNKIFGGSLQRTVEAASNYINSTDGSAPTYSDAVNENNDNAGASRVDCPEAILVTDRGASKRQVERRTAT